MVRLTLKQCAYFIAVAEQGGIAQASRILNISQPAVAQGINKLEEQYGIQLFERRHARGTELTPQGRAFIGSARSLLEQAEHTEHQARSISANLSGVIRFGCFHTIAPFYLSQIVRKHRVVHPEVEIAATELRQDDIVHEVASGKIDIALTYDMSLGSFDLDRRTVATLKPHLLLSKDHPLAKRSSIQLAELADEPYVMFDGPSSREYFESLLETHGIRPPISFNATSMESVRSAVANGLGFSLSVMKLDFTDTYGGGEVIAIPVDEKVQSLSVVLLRRKSATTSDQLTRFSDFCAKHIGE